MVTSDMRRCVPVDQGMLSPDLRVNYEFGLVLGVDEFRQEQLYHLQKEYIQNRSLHGYGTVSGLHVTLSPVNGDDVQVNVSPGIGIDQIGRMFVVRQEQCAALGPWLDKQDGEVDRIYVVASYDECLDALVPIAGEPCRSSEAYQAASRIRDSVAISLRATPPPMPAWDGIKLLMALMSRVRLDASIALEDSEEGELTALIRLIADEPDRVYDALTTETGGDIATFALPAVEAHEAIDRIMTVWTTEIRPLFPPDLVQPAEDAETAVLLAVIERATDGETGEIEVEEARNTTSDETGGGTRVAIPGIGERFPTLREDIARREIDTMIPRNLERGNVLVNDFRLIARRARSAAVNGWLVDNTLRPHLLSTQVIQSLLFMGGVGESKVPIVLDPFTVDTLVTRDDAGNASVSLALYLGSDRSFTLMEDAVTLRRLRDGLEMTYTVSPVTGGAVQRWDFTPRATLVNDDLVELRINTDRVADADGRTITQIIRDEGLAIVGYDGDHITLYHVVDVPPAPVSGGGGGLTAEQVREILREQIEALHTVPFVTITPLAGGDNSAEYEMWFHLDQIAHEFDVGAANELAKNLNVKLFYEGIENDNVQQVPISMQTGQISQSPTKDNAFRISLSPDWLGLWKVNRPVFARFVFPLDSGNGFAGTGTLREYMKANNIKFSGSYISFKETADPEMLKEVGFEGNPEDGEGLVVYVRMPNGGRG